MTVVDPLSERLLRSSARQSYDPEVDIDWDAPEVPGLWWMQPERTSLYGTRTWERLSEEQRFTLAKHEIASLVSVGIWFEIVLMRLLLREAYACDPRAERTQYALTEVGDETRHTVMFGRALRRLGVPAYGPRRTAYQLGKLAGVLRGPSFYAAVLIGEEPVDRLQREMMKDERVQPMARMISRIHVTEEARHVTFARDELAKAAAQPRGRTALRAHQHLVAQVGYVTMRSLVHPDCYATVGLDPAEARREALGNPHYRATIAWMGEKVMPVLTEHGMVSERDRKVWRASFLMP
jgi:histone H3/H4